MGGEEEKAFETEGKDKMKEKNVLSEIKKMKITKGRLKEIIKEELERNKPDWMEANEDLAEEVVQIAVNEGDFYRAFKAGKMKLEEMAKKASEMVFGFKMEEIKDALFHKPQLDYVAKLLKKYYKEEE